MHCLNEAASGWLSHCVGTGVRGVHEAASVNRAIGEAREHRRKRGVHQFNTAEYLNLSALKWEIRNRSFVFSDSKGEVPLGEYRRVAAVELCNALKCFVDTRASGKLRR